MCVNTLEDSNSFMKTKTLSLLLSVFLIVSMTACGQKSADSSGKAEEASVAAEADSMTDSTSMAAEDGSMTDLASAAAEDGSMTDLEASAETAEASIDTAKASGEKDLCEANGHKWLENTPNYQQPKTCEVCGATEGEPLEAKNKSLKKHSPNL